VCIRVCVVAKKINGYSYCFTAIYHRMLSSARVVYISGIGMGIGIGIEDAI